MRHWQDVLGHIRLLGPDIPVFREDVKFINDHIEKLERQQVYAREALAFIVHSDMPWSDARVRELARGTLDRMKGVPPPTPVVIDENWPGYEC